MDNLFYLAWALKRYIWPLMLCASALTAWVVGFTLLCNILAGLLAFRLSLDLWNSLQFQPYNLIDPITQRPKTWQAILLEFDQNSHKSLAFYGLAREKALTNIASIIERGYIRQSGTNYLCGPISFLNFLIKHHPALFVKTYCEFYENGSTKAPFYLQSSFWDRYKRFPLISFFKHFFKKHITPQETLAAAFKNTYNLFGYNHRCYFENFKGCTEPKRIVQWLSLAGFDSTSHVTLNNYTGSDEISLLSRLLLGGAYAEENRIRPLEEHGPEQAYLTYYNYHNENLTYFYLNLSLGHWSFHYRNTPPDREGVIQIHLPSRRF